MQSASYRLYLLYAVSWW